MSSSLDIKNQIITKLNAMQGLKTVSGYPVGNIDGKYPLATVTLRRSSAQIRSTACNLRTRSYWIRVYQEVSKIGQGPEQAERIIANLADEIEKAFDMDTTLSGVVQYCEPISVNYTYRNREHDIRTLEIQLDTKELVSAS